MTGELDAAKDMRDLTARYLAGDADIAPEDVRAAIDDFDRALAVPSTEPTGEGRPPTTNPVLTAPDLVVADSRQSEGLRCGNCPHSPDAHSPVNRELCAIPGCECPGLLTVAATPEPTLDAERLARQLWSALIAVPYHANPKLPLGHPFGYSPNGHREYECTVCIALYRASQAFGDYDYDSDPRYAAARLHERTEP